MESQPGSRTAPAHVQLGEHNYPVYPQKIGYLENKLKGFFDQFTSGDFDTGTLAQNGYELLRIFIPRLMPEHEFRGYGSADEHERGDYDPERDQSPDFGQIVEAFQACMKVNRFDLFTQLKAVIDPSLLRATVNDAVARSIISKSGGPSATDAAAITDGASTTSGTTAPTSTPSEASPSID